MKPAINAMAWAAMLLCGTASTFALAQIVAAPGSGAQVIQTQNGLAQVNIARPSAAGVSRNNYSQFDVQRQGAILNNSPTIVQTQQAGYINGNPNLTPGISARIIVNQVMSNAPSQLRGYTEVAGPRAEVVIANPSGIIVDGAGFINTSRAVLSTGTPNFGANGSLAGFNVTGGNITVQGAGLNATNVDQVDLLARAIQVNAAIYANNLNAVAGANQIDHDTLNTTPIAVNGPAPSQAIDVSALGGMYAQRIYLTSNEYGVGVSTRGILAAQAGDLVLKSNGQLVLAGQTNASGSISASAAQGIDNSGTTYAQGNVYASAGGALNNSGVLASQNNTTVNAGSVASTGTIGAGINGDGSIASNGDLNVSASGALSATGRNAAGANGSMQGASMNLAGSSTTANGNLALVATTGDMNLSGATTTAGGAINANAAGTLINDNGALKSGSTQTVTAGALSNRNAQMIAGGAMSQNIAGAVQNQGGTMQAAGALSAHAGSIDNTGGNIAALGSDALSLTVDGALNNTQNGAIGGNGDVFVQTGQLVNAGSMSAVRNLTANAAQTLVNSGTLAANGNVAVSAGTVLSNSGAMSAGEVLSASASTLDNSGGTINGDQLALRAANLVNHNGRIVQTGTGATTISVSNTLDNVDGTIATNAQDLSLAPAALLNDNGKITSSGTGTLSITSGSVSNKGGTIATNGALVENVSGALQNQGGTMQAGGALSAHAGSIDNTGGNVAALGSGALSLTVDGALNNGLNGAIGGNGDVIVQAGQIANAGAITAVHDLSAKAAQSLVNSGTLAANGNASASAGTTFTNSGTLAAGHVVSANASTVDNSAGVISGDQVAVTAGNLTNHNGTITQTGTNATTLSVSGTLDNASGTIATNARDLTLAPGTLLNDNGRITSSGTGTLSITSGSVSNNGGTIATNGALVEHISGAVQNQGGTMQAGSALNVSAASINNVGGQIASLGNVLNVSTTGLLDNASNGTIASNGDVAVQSGQLANAGSITAKGNLIASATQTLFNSGTLASNGKTNITAGTTLTNFGTIAGNLLTLSAYDLVNRTSVTQTGTGATSFTVSNTLDNTNGSIQTNGDLSLAPATLLNDSGVIASAGTGTLSVSANALSNNGGTIATNGALTVNGGAVSNRGGTLAAQSSVSLDVASLDNSAGGYAGAQDVSVRAAGALNNVGGTIQANDTMNVSALSIANDGGAIANGGTGAMTVASNGALTNTNGLIGGNGDVSIAGGSVDNSGGTFVAGGVLSAQSNDAIVNHAGLMQAGGDIAIHAQGEIDNAGGQIEADGANSALTISGASLDNTSGRIANSGTGASTIDAQSIINSNANGVAGAGTIGGNGAVTLNADVLSNTNGAQVLSGRSLALNIAQRVDNANATLSGASALTFNGANAALVNANGSVHSNGALTLNTASIDNTSGRIGNDQGSGGSVAIQTNALANQDGAIGSDQDLSVTTNTLNGDGRIIAGNDGAVTINGDYTLNGVNRIQANHDLSFTTTGDFTNQGALAAVNALTVNARNVDNQAGADLNSATTTVNAQNAINNEGRIEGDTVATNSATLKNSATIIGNEVTLSASQSITNDGAAAVIAGASQVNLYSRGDIGNTNGANVFSLGDIDIAGDATRDANGVLANRANTVTNDQSTIEAQGDIEVAANTLNNTRPAVAVDTVTTDVETEHGTKRAKYVQCATNYAGSCSNWTDYKTPFTRTFSDADVVSTSTGTNAVDRVLVVNVNGTPTTIYYNSLTQNADGTTTVVYWDGYDPHINYDPATEYATRDDAHKGWQRVEIARDTTTTTQQDQVSGPQAPQAQLLAGGVMTLANVGTINNAYSAIAAGDAIQIGGALTNGQIDANGNGNIGGTIVNNIGQTLYQYQRQDIVSTYAWNEDISRDVGKVVEPSIVLAPVAIGGTGGTIIANNLIDINARDVNNVNVAAANSATGATGGTLGANTAIAQVAGASGNGVDAAGGASVNGASGSSTGAATSGNTPSINTASGQTGQATANGAIIDAPQSVAGPTGALNIPLPTSGLYHYNASPDAAYLIATDPRLTSYTSFISSDYMLNALNLDPSKTMKRLGDGVYEQQLIRNQITQLTGRVYLQGYTSNEDEYRALMMNGVNYAQEFNLVPGMALTAAQMDALTRDIVWLVEQTVTLPDGSTQHVLAPVVYLAQAHANDLRPTGALISADDVEIHATGNVNNSGVIKGGTQTVITGTNILNRGGSISSDGTTVMSATNDITNASGRISGNRVAVLAGHDIVNTTLADAAGVASVAGNSRVQQTLIGAQGTIASTGDMLVSAGHDLTVHGASINAGGNAQITAGNNILVDAVQSNTSQSVTKNADHHWEENTTLNQTSAISAGGSLAMQSGNDATFKGASVSAGADMSVVAGGNITATTVTNSLKFDNVATDDKTKRIEHDYDEQAQGTSFNAGGNATVAAVSTDKAKGNVTLTGSTLSTETGAANIVATGDVTLNEAREEHDNYTYVHSERGSVIKKTTTDEMQNTQANIGVGSTVSGDTVSIRSGNDVTVQGSNVVGTHDVTIDAAGDVKITTSQDTYNDESFYQKRESGFLSGMDALNQLDGGLKGYSIGVRKQTDAQQSTQVTNNASMIGSLDGSLNIKSGNDLHVTGSTLHGGNDIDLSGKTVTIDAAQNVSNQGEQQSFSQTGVTASLSSPVLAAVQTANQMRQDVRHTNGDARLDALAAATTALAGKNAYDAVASDPAHAGGIGVNVSLGTSHSHSSVSTMQTSAAGSTISAGNNVTIKASGAGADSNISVIGSDIKAANNATLDAQGSIDLQAAQNTQSMRTDNSGSSGSIGVTIGFGSNNGISFQAGVSGTKGNGNSDGQTWTNTHVDAGNTMTLHSGGDTTLKGADVSGNRVVADVGGNLNIESLQDTNHYDSRQLSGGVSVNVCVPPICYGAGSSVSANISREKMTSDYASVTEQSGIHAGDGGFSIDVKGNTDLRGGVIASDADASKNALSTGTLTYSYIENHASYDASSVGVGGGYGTGPVGKDQSGTASNTNYVPGTELPSSGGAKIAPPVVLSASGDASSTTRSGISAGTITITDAAHQTQDVASLNRDTSDTGGAIAPIFDREKIEAGFDIASQFVNQAGTFVANRVKEADQATQDAKNPDLTPEQRAAAQQRADELNSDWGPSGSYRQALTALTIAAGGNVTGGAAQFAQSATVAYIQQLGANEVKQLITSLDGDNTPQGEAARAALHAIVGCAGAAGSGASCGAGAMGAAASSVIGSLMSSTENMSASDRLVRESLVNSLVAGVAAGIDTSGADIATAAGAAQIEVQNNQVAPLPVPPIFTPGDTKPPFQIPGLEWLAGNKSDGVIADPTAQLDPSAGVHVTPNPIEQVFDAIYTPISDTMSSLADSIKTMAGYQPNQGAVGNMSQYINSPGFGSDLGDATRKTNIIVQGQSVYRANSDIGGNIDRGDFVYLDGQHKNHLEVFDSRGNFKMVLNLDGSVNRSKTDAGSGRKINVK